ncbi:MAG: 50S ribosomal protein L10 [Nanoarchaeota archaeon]|nr:50S ribosomal protein L10 [Nanoarchaeota archaeon]MBU0962753.1 50S ribosomal protein L10 [Nanoarchaeota archaeon]
MKVQNWKKQEVESIKKLIEEYPVIGIVDGTNLPSMQLQKIRFKLKPDVLIKMTKSRLLKLALEQLKDKKKGIENLENYIRYNIPILIFTREGAFKLSKNLLKNRSSAAAKPGQKAPNDIIISAGPTEFTPGPVIGELGQIGLKTAVEGGKIVIKEDKLVVKEGDLINDKVASVLSKLGIQPMKIGINLVVAYDNGDIYGKDILNVDEEKYINDIKLAASQAFNLAFSIKYPTKENIKLLIIKAVLEGKSIESKVNIGEIIKEKKNEVPETKVKKIEEPIKEVKPEEKPIIEQKEIKKEPIVEKPEVKETKEESKKEIKEEKIEVKEEQKIEKEEKKESNIPDKFDEYSKKAQEILTELQDQKIKKGKY